MSHIDWKVELRKIEREFDGKPPMPSPAVIKARRDREQREKEAVELRVTQLSALARLSLVIALTAALPWWPYATRCGAGVAGLVAAYAMVAIGGLWVAAYSWRHRLAASHALALAFLMAGLLLVASQVLPRAGYVTIHGVDASGWSCTVAAAPAANAPVASADAPAATTLEAADASGGAGALGAGTAEAATAF
jgi:hypothetical protein